MIKHTPISDKFLVLSVGQPDGVSVAQKEEASEPADTVQDEVAPQVNGDTVEKVSPDASDISAVEEKAAEEKSDDTNEVGFKKIFRFVGFKFTLKKDKTEEKDPVKLLTVKDKEVEEEEVSKTEEQTKETEAATVENTGEEKEADKDASPAEVNEDGDKTETTEAEEEPVKEGEPVKEVDTTQAAQETTLSPFRKLFNGGLFSNLRKKASIKKTKEEEEKEVPAEEGTAKTEETAPAVEETEANDDTEQETKEIEPETPGEETTEAKEEITTTPEEAKSESITGPDVTPAPAAPTTDENKKEDTNIESTADVENPPTDATPEGELLSSQEKAKPQGSPLKKLFTGAGLKKLSTKKQKTKKEAETKLTESGEQVAEQLQSSTDSAEAPKAESGPSSPQESGEHVAALDATRIESSQETSGEVTSDGEKKKEGIIAWSSFKKLVTPKKRVKRSSESEDEATGEKQAKSATLSSSESANLTDKSVEEETKEDKPTEEEPKTENNEKLVSSTEEPKRKMDTSVSWEALMCMGGPKKRTRKTSDSDDEETKIGEEIRQAAEGEQEGKTEAVVVCSQNSGTEGEVVSSPEPLSSPPERESAWDTLKRVVMPKNKAKVEEKPGESSEQVQSDSEAPKDESSFSFKKFLPGRRKKKVDKQASSDLGSGEDDSDTPAVVPLSEYNKPEEAEPEVPADTEPDTEPATEPTTEPAAIENKVSAEDRSPSWIPAVVENFEEKHDELSDIPEEAETAATPKSVDTDIVEDEIEDDSTQLPKAPGRSGRRLSMAEVKPVDPAPAAETTPVPQGPSPDRAEEVIEGIEAQLNEIPFQTSVSLHDVPIEVVSEKIEDEPSTEKAESKTNTILEPHTSDEAMAICTGLGTKEIAKVALEKPATAIVESMAVIGDGLSTEIAMEEKPPCTVEAIDSTDAISMAQVHQVEATSLDTVAENSLSNQADIQAAGESHEPEIEKIGIVNIVVKETEVIQPPDICENSPKAVVVNSITQTTEPAVSTLITEVTEPTIEIKELETETEQVNATEENTPVEAIVEAICEITKVSLTRETEPALPVEVPSEKVPVVTETVVLVAPVSVDSDQAVTEHNEPIQTQEVCKDGSSLETPDLSVGVDQASEKVEEIKVEVQQASDLKAQSIVIAQTVIQDAVDKVSEDEVEPKEPSAPTVNSPEPEQALATTEKEIEMAAETPVITDTPNVVTCEKSSQPLRVAMEVIDSTPLEVAQSLDADIEEEKKTEEGLKKAVEVQVSENTVAVEEVGEIKEDIQSVEKPERTKEEESREDKMIQEPDIKEAAEEVKTQTEEAKSEAPSEENQENVFEIHMPVQVVLQTAQVMEEPAVEEETVEVDSSSPTAKDTNIQARSIVDQNKLSVLSEEPQATSSTEGSAPSEDTKEPASQPEKEKKSPVKYTEVMAQVIEVIEEAVKEIEPVSADITAAS